jgi:protein phosphatase
VAGDATDDHDPESGGERRYIIIGSYGLRIGHATHQGRVRELNEDGYLVLAPPAISPELAALLVVADGMGGHQAGDVASSEVIQILNELFSSAAYQEQVGYSLDRDDYYVVVLKEILEQVNDRLYNLQASGSDLRGMGTTGSVALLVNQHLYIGHVGDSRIYRLRGGELQRLTNDHSWVAEQVALGAMTPQEAAVHPKKNLLTQCLGQSPVLRVERTVHELQIGDMLLLCSDGLTAVVQDVEIAQMLTAYPHPQETCRAMVDLANQRGGPDNITVLVAQVVEGAGTDLPGGRAYGPHHEVATSQLVDTIKIARPKQQGSQPAAKPPAGQTRPRQSASHPLLVPALGLAIALACGLVGWLALKSLGEGETLVFLTISVSTLVGVVAGLALSSLLYRTRVSHAGEGVEKPEESNSPQV